MKQIKQHTSPLKFYIILITFISTAVTPMLIGWIFLLISNWSGDYGPSPYFPLFTMLVESLLAGIVLTLLVNRLLLSPLVSFSDAIKKWQPATSPCALKPTTRFRSLDSWPDISTRWFRSWEV